MLKSTAKFAAFSIQISCVLLSTWKGKFAIGFPWQKGVFENIPKVYQCAVFVCSVIQQYDSNREEVLDLQ